MKWNTLIILQLAKKLKCARGPPVLCRDTRLLDQIAGLGYSYFMEVPVDTRVWLERPQTAVPEGTGRGRKPCRERLVEGGPAPLTVQEVVPIQQYAMRSHSGVSQDQ